VLAESGLLTAQIASIVGRLAFCLWSSVALLYTALPPRVAVRRCRPCRSVGTADCGRDAFPLDRGASIEDTGRMQSVESVLNQPCLVAALPVVGFVVGSRWPAAAPILAAAAVIGGRRQYEAWSAEPGWIMVVADCDGAIRGYAAARIAESVSAWDFGARIGRLESLAVEPGARGHRLGTALTDAVRAHWQGLGVRFATVSVIAGNDAAQRFYARLGAVEFTRTSIFGV
jgi:ribosomal protein S18 acetylase RimI-like enzyme